MIKQIYKKQDLPMDELQKLGLVQNGHLQLTEDDLAAMLAGRRSDMLCLKNLTIDSLHIIMLDAKISLMQNVNGDLELCLHPIYRQLQIPQFIDDMDAKMLEKGILPNLPMRIIGDDNMPKEVLIEFDKDTNEFVVSDIDIITSPEGINGVPLTPWQKERYCKGRAVDTDDGTTIVYSATARQGIRSDKQVLIASVLIDGIASQVLYQGLNTIFGWQQDKQPGSNYERAFKGFQQAQARTAGNNMYTFGSTEQTIFVPFTR